MKAPLSIIPFSGVIGSGVIDADGHIVVAVPPMVEGKEATLERARQCLFAIEHMTAKTRVRKWLDALREKPLYNVSLNPFHVLHAGTKWEAALYVEDLEKLVRQL